MPARAIWQGNMLVQKHQIAVKLYGAVSDRQIHFHLLHKRDRTRLQQRMVDTETKEPVAPADARKTFEAEPGLFIELTPEEIKQSVPPAAREIRVRQFVPDRLIEPQFFDRPYYLGPVDPSRRRTTSPWRKHWKTRSQPGSPRGSCGSILMQVLSWRKRVT